MSYTNKMFSAVVGIPPRSGVPPNSATNDSLNMTDISV